MFLTALGRPPKLAVVLGHTTPPAAFEGVEDLILIDTHDSPLAGRASVVLPARSFAERAGTFTNHANRVQRFLPIVEPVFEAWAEGEVLRQLAAAAGLSGGEERFDPALVGVRLAESVPAFAGVHFGTVGDQGQELP